jgi:hypothetical protein
VPAVSTTRCRIRVTSVAVRVSSVLGRLEPMPKADGEARCLSADPEFVAELRVGDSDHS